MPPSDDNIIELTYQEYEKLVIERENVTFRLNPTVTAEFKKLAEQQKKSAARLIESFMRVWIAVSRVAEKKPKR